jgi:hypothetical protein
MSSVRDDAARMAHRYMAVFEMLAGAHEPDHELVIVTFEELIKAEVIFPGPSLYADPLPPEV